MAVSEKLLKWREKKGRGEIMRPETFEKIVRQTMSRYGLSRERAEKVAGKAYWTTAKAKYSGHKSHLAQAIERKGK